MGSQAQFDALADLLQNEYDFYRFDFYGHGKAVFSDGFGIEAFARQAEEFMRDNNLEGCAVFGYSMGGYVALFLESAHPGTFSSIMTLGTKFNWNPETSVKEAAFLDPGIIFQKVPKYAAQLENLHGNKWGDLCRRSAEMMITLGIHPALNSEKLTGIGIPVRIGLGDKDKMVSLDESNQAYRSLSRGSFLVIPATPHPLDQVDADRLAHEVRAFFPTALSEPQIQRI